MDVPVDAATLVYGVFLAGMGRMDVDDVHFLPVPVGAMSTTVFEESQLKLKQGETYTPPSIVQDAPANLDFERVPGTGSERRGPLARRAWGDARRDAGQGLWQGGRGPPAAGSGSTHGTWPITRIALARAGGLNSQRDHHAARLRGLRSRRRGALRHRRRKPAALCGGGADAVGGGHGEGVLTTIATASRFPAARKLVRQLR